MRVLDFVNLTFISLELVYKLVKTVQSMVTFQDQFAVDSTYSYIFYV